MEVTIWQVTTVPGKPGNPGKTGFFKISPVKHWKQCAFQDNVSGKSGKKLFSNNSLEIYFIYSLIHIFVEPII